MNTSTSHPPSVPPPRPSHPRLIPRLSVPGPLGARQDVWELAGLILSLAYYYLMPQPLLALPGLAVFAYLAWRRLGDALCLLPLTFPFWYVPKRVFGHTVFPLSEIALAVCTAVALVRIAPMLRAAASRARLAHQVRLALARLGPWLGLGAAVLAAGTALGVLVALRPHEALRAYRWEVVEPLLYLALVLVFARRRASARLLVWSFIGSALVVVLLATLQVGWLHVTFTPLAQGNRLVAYQTATGGIPRATAFIYGSGNSLGAWIARALPITLAMALCDRVARRERLLAAACALCCLPALVWSASRGAWAAAALACAVVACIALRRLWLPVVLVGIAALLALWQRGEVSKLLLAGHGGTGEVRLLVWLASLRMIRDHPLLGIGPDQFLYYYDPAYTSHPYLITRYNGHPTRAALEPNLAQPHNLVLDLWLSGGLLALAGFALALGDFWRRCLRLWRAGTNASRGTTGWAAAAALGLAGSALAGVLHGLVDNAYFAPDLALAFWWAVATLVVLERAARHEAQPRGRRAA
jgi:putative inorganic carbon (hco3(-)) transporter